MDIRRQTQTISSDGVSVSPEQSGPLCLGYDPGQHPDPAAIALVRMEQRPVPGKWDAKAYVPEYVTPKGFRTPAHYGAPIMETHYMVHHLEVLHALPYPDQITYLSELLREPVFRHRKVKVRVDIIQVIGVRFVGGEVWNRSKQPESLGKGALVATLLQRLQWRLVHASPDIVDLAALQAELEVFNREMDEATGNTQYGAQSGYHDDRCIALALGILEDVFANQVRYSERIW